MLSNELRKQRLGMIHAKLLETSARFPQFEHYAIRSDDNDCARALNSGLADVAASTIRQKMYATGQIGQAWFEDEIAYLTRVRKRGRSFVTTFGAHDLAWSSCLYHRGIRGDYEVAKSCVLSLTRRLDIAERSWFGKFVDSARCVSARKGIPIVGSKRLIKHPAEALFLALATEVVYDLYATKRPKNAALISQERTLTIGLLERLYELFPQNVLRFGVFEIVTLPWNVFLTTAHAVERMLTEPDATKTSQSDAISIPDSERLAGIPKGGRGYNVQKLLKTLRLIRSHPRIKLATLAEKMKEDLAESTLKTTYLPILTAHFGIRHDDERDGYYDPAVASDDG